MPRLRRFGQWWPVRHGPGEPFRVLVAGAAPVGDALAAQKGDVALHPARHRAPGELAILLTVALAVPDVRAQRGSIERADDFICDNSPAFQGWVTRPDD